MYVSYALSLSIGGRWSFLIKFVLELRALLLNDIVLIVVNRDSVPDRLEQLSLEQDNELVLDLGMVLGAEA